MENGQARVIDGLREIRHNLFEMLSAQRNAATLIREVTPAGSKCHPQLRGIERRCNELIARGRASLSEGGQLGSRLLHAHDAPARRHGRHAPLREQASMPELVAELVQHLIANSTLLVAEWQRLESAYGHELNPSLLRLCHVVLEESRGFLILLEGLEQRLLSLAAPAGHATPAKPDDLGPRDRLP